MDTPSPRILMIEANEQDYQLSRQALAQSDLSCEIVWTQSGHEALKQLQAVEFDVVIFNFQPAPLNNLGIFQQIIRTNLNLPTVFVVESGQEEVISEAIKMGAQDYLIKDPAGKYLKLLPAIIHKADNQGKNSQAHRQAELEIIQRNGELLTLQYAGAALAASLDLQQVLNTVTLEMTNLLNVEGCAISEWDQTTNSLTLMAAYSSEGWQEEASSSRYYALADYSLTRQVLVERRAEQMTISQPDIDATELAYMQQAEFKTRLLLPMEFQNRLVGLAELMDSRVERTFAPPEVALAQLLANQAASAIENARLYEQAQQEIIERKRAEAAEREQRRLAEALYQAETQRRYGVETMRDATTALTSALDLEQVLNNILIYLERVVPYDSACVFLVEGDQFHAAAGRGFPAPVKIIGQDFPTTESFVYQKSRHIEHPVILADVQTEPDFYPWEGLDYIRGWMGVPLMARGRFIGYLTLDSKQVAAYSETDATLAQAFANQAAAAIENTRLFETAKQRVTELETVHQVNLSLAASLELQTVLDTILESLFKLLRGVKNAHIFLYESGRITFGTALWAGGHKGQPFAEPRPQGLTYTVARQEQPIFVDDIRHHSLFVNAPPDWSGSIAGIPLKIGPRVVGVMNISHSQPRTWPESELRVLQLLAEQAAIAIENARLYERAQQEIAERKRAEAELDAYRVHLETLVQQRTAELEQAMAETASARDKIDAILQSVADGLIVTDLDHRVILANPAAETLLGFRLEDVENQDIETTIKASWLREIVQSTLRHHMSGCEIDVKLKDSIYGDKQPKIINARTALVDDRQGQPLGTVTIIRDVTELREVDRLKTEFLTLAAHEFRTPLTSILGYSEILLNRRLNETRQQQYLATIHEQASHLAEITNNLLDISRFEAGQALKMKTESVDMAALIQELLPQFTKTTSKHQLQVGDLSGLPPVMGDSFRLKQVIRNILSNAIKYSPQGGTIAIGGQVRGDRVEFRVRDEGIGMTPEQQTQLFKRFYRANTSSTAISGVGLGLTISKIIVDLHGGEIWVESEYGVGTTVYFTLPRPQA